MYINCVKDKLLWQSNIDKYINIYIINKICNYYIKIFYCDNYQGNIIKIINFKIWKWTVVFLVGNSALLLLLLIW